MKNQNGFSLLEVAFALIIIGVGFTTLLQFFPHALRTGQIARDESAQTLFANAVFSKLNQKAMETVEWNKWKADDWIEEVCDFKPWQQGTAATPFRVESSSLSHIKEFKDRGVGAYLMVVGRSRNGKIVHATLWSTPHDVAKVTGKEKQMEILKQGTAFHSEFYFMGDQ